MFSARLLACDSCPETAPADESAGGWFVFHDCDGPGNARCPACLPNDSAPVDLAQL